ncbi:DNA methylase [Shewanella sp. WE21]|uniref:DNA adenine methylase n=2 Tax=Shewanella TaxID=22 RepID=UPI000CF6AB38|nr:DNA adenine methylase [Shewanella sp. WE21]AVI68326.1 DNA methylase [Shewanella sp. WE21]
MTAAAKSYLGAKNGSGVYQAIINLIPPHQTYVEAFLGTGAIMRRKAPAQTNIGIEINQSVIDKFNHAAAELNISMNIINANAIEWLKTFKPTGKTVIYLDPPYVHSTRTSNARYKNELTDADHAELLATIKKLANTPDTYIIISGYRNALYDVELHNWYSKDFQAMTRGGVRTETVWCNFLPGEQHYHTFAGKDFTDRQRIKRKAERWAKNFEALPAAERQAVMAALLAIDN